MVRPTAKFGNYRDTSLGGDVDLPSISSGRRINASPADSLTSRPACCPSIVADIRSDPTDQYRAVGSTTPAVIRPTGSQLRSAPQPLHTWQVAGRTSAREWLSSIPASADRYKQLRSIGGRTSGERRSDWTPFWTLGIPSDGKIDTPVGKPGGASPERASVRPLRRRSCPVRETRCPVPADRTRTR